ncbi:MAG: hypothetical protein A3J74_03010 [Elusimicrobia bacterium RIFCSPHIGHO2_02_FULL_57_9]|nr:MAG: hypothetical protein A3J74_03010 [Elusimicrobia bacterium RIFCSPHIGHO2_02_FULL_57_9]
MKISRAAIMPICLALLSLPLSTVCGAAPRTRAATGPKARAIALPASAVIKPAPAITVPSRASALAAGEIGTPPLSAPQTDASTLKNLWAMRQGSTGMFSEFKSIHPTVTGQGESAFLEPTIWNIRSAKKYYSEIYQGMSDGERESFGYYSGGWYDRINSYLRQKPESRQPDHLAQTHIERMQSVIDRAPNLPKNLVIYRVELFENRPLPEIGTQMEAEAFLSYALGDRTMDRYLYHLLKTGMVTAKTTVAIYVTIIKGNQKGIFLSPDMAAYFSELGEVILPPGTTQRVLHRDDNDKSGPMTVTTLITEIE